MQSERILNLGVVGFGKLGLLHASLANSLPGCRLAAVADNQHLMLAILKAQMPAVATYLNHAEMVREGRVDAVFIATPTHLHVPVALDFVKAGIPIFVEKPLGLNAAQIQPLLAAVKASGIVNMVGYMNRFNESFQKARDILQSEALGHLLNFRATMYIEQVIKTGKGWRFSKNNAGGGVLITQNSHLIDLLLWLFGDMDWVSGQTQTLYSKEVEDAVHAYCGFRSGLRGWIDTSWSARHYRLLTTSLAIQGEAGTLQVDDDEVSLYLEQAAGGYEKGWSRWRKPDLFQPVSVDLAYPHFSRQAEEFVQALRGKRKIECDLFSAYKTQLAIDAIYESAEHQGAPVKIKESSSDAFFR